MTEGLKGQVAIITGASRGIGLAVAQALAAQDVAVALVGRSEATIQAASETIQKMGKRAIPLRANVTDQRAVDSLVEETIRRLGPIDLLINNAGIGTAAGPIWEVSPENWWQDVATNLLGTFLCSRAVLPGMISRRHGTIVNIVSAFGIQTDAQRTHRVSREVSERAGSSPNTRARRRSPTRLAPPRGSRFRRWSSAVVLPSCS